MDDRFRFRVWHEPKGITRDKPIMIYNAEDTYDCMTGEPVIIYKSCFGDVLEDDEYTIMQCTGLKDKNGKLIYEGDIVRFKDCNDILVVNYQKEMACFAPQFYSKGKYGGRLWFDDYDSFEHQFYKSNNFEVIGNIYENKELLDE